MLKFIDLSHCNFFSASLNADIIAGFIRVIEGCPKLIGLLLLLNEVRVKLTNKVDEKKNNGKIK